MAGTSRGGLLPTAINLGGAAVFLRCFDLFEKKCSDATIKYKCYGLLDRLGLEDGLGLPDGSAIQRKTARSSSHLRSTSAPIFVFGQLGFSIAAHAGGIGGAMLSNSPAGFHLSRPTGQAQSWRKALRVWAGKACARQSGGDGRDARTWRGLSPGLERLGGCGVMGMSGSSGASLCASFLAFAEGRNGEAGWRWDGLLLAFWPILAGVAKSTC